MAETAALSAKKRRFVEEYLRCGDAASAAEAAGYAPEKGETLLCESAVQHGVREGEQRLYDALGISSAWVGRRLVEIVERCMQAVPHYSRNPETKQREPDGTWEFDPTGALRALHELSEHIRSLEEDTPGAGSVSFEEWLAKRGEEGGL